MIFEGETTRIFLRVVSISLQETLMFSELLTLMIYEAVGSQTSDATEKLTDV